MVGLEKRPRNLKALMLNLKKPLLRLDLAGLFFFLVVAFFSVEKRQYQ
jgi:hypothetical protein